MIMCVSISVFYAIIVCLYIFVFDPALPTILPVWGVWNYYSYLITGRAENK